MTMQMGALLPASRFRRLLGGELEAWRLRALEQERQFGVQTLFTSADTVDVDAGSARMAVAMPQGWQEHASGALPRVWHNAMVCPRPPESRALRSLNGDLSTVVFNETNRWDRGMVYDILAAQTTTGPYAPPTLPCKPECLEALVPQAGLVLLTTRRHAVRSGAVLLESEDRQLRYTCFPTGESGKLQRQQAWATELGSRFPGLRWACKLRERPLGPRGPVEWRLYVQRSEAAGWDVAAAVAKSDALLLGERPVCWRWEEALQLTFGAQGGEMGERLQTAALAVAGALARFLPGTAHCAMDFWVGPDGCPILADLSGRYRTDWLRRVGDVQGLQRVSDYPVRFARRLLQTGVGKLDVDFGDTGQLPGALGSVAASHLAEGAAGDVASALRGASIPRSPLPV